MLKFFCLFFIFTFAFDFLIGSDSWKEQITARSLLIRPIQSIILALVLAIWQEPVGASKITGSENQ